MAFDIANRGQVSKTINETATASQAVIDGMTALQRFRQFFAVNGIQAALVAPGAVFPSGFSLTPAEISAARNAIIGVITAMETSLTAAERTNLDRVILNLGFLTGTG
jgi:hypothetical protein